MRQLCYWMAGLMIAVSLGVSGCGGDQGKLVKAQTPTQEAFYALSANYDKEKYDQVMAQGEAFIDNYPEHFFVEAVHYYMGSSARKLGKTDQARAHFEKITEMNPDGNWAQLARFNMEEMDASQ